MKGRRRLTGAFCSPLWREVRLDIDPQTEPDFVASITDMASIADGTIDAIYSSHNLEHLYGHEVPLALSEFRRVLNRDGFAVITCPDLQAICALVAEDKLSEPAYESPAGPISPLDVLYGHIKAVAAGRTSMAHRCGFTRTTLTAALTAAGFGTLAAKRRPHPHFDLWAVATREPVGRDSIAVLAAEHFPA